MTYVDSIHVIYVFKHELLGVYLLCLKTKT